MSESEPLLVGRGLTKHYGGVVALSEVDLHVDAGEILGLVGPNGAGKTTLVDLVTGAQPATAGSLTLQGRPLSGGAARRARAGLARTFQHPLVPDELTVVEAITAGVSARRLHTPWSMVLELLRGMVTGPDRDFQRAAALAAETGITGLDRHCSDLSLGEQRLLEVVRALAQDPQVMLLDEPFAGADPGGIAGIIDAIRQVQQRGHGVILVDHNVDLIADLADRVMLLSEGRVVFDGSPAACLSSAEMKRVYFGGDDD
ncbi:ABC transporter ATP-binding protein [Enemella dayhoffiae]|uniref:ABC transporter ATP-binding protein n=1 Tax=Enemella dayhoffiae TaxID=2016507 RepID=A0A255GL50_9ACTN|nr:ATP-binding cassette domain-containing protein [Enemella dayhoffiae]OYO16568.1 ABC transporter ATP-binding protein [Enemella dayhoffiae]